MGSRTFRFLLFSALLAVALLWRLPVSPVEWHLLSCDPDSLFHLHRASLAAQDGLRVPSVDLYAHFPAAYRSHWLAPLTVAYAAILRAAGLTNADLDSQAALLSWLPPIIGCLAIVIAAQIAYRLRRSHPAGMVAALMIAVDQNCYRTFFLGFIDHHMFATLGCLALVLARLRHDFLLWFAALFVLLATTPEATFLATVFLFVFGLSELAAAPSVERKPFLFRWMTAPAAAAALVLVGQRFLETDPLPLEALSWFYFTAFQPLFLLCLGAGFFGLCHWVGAIRDDRPVHDRVLRLTLFGVAIIGGALLFAHTPDFAGELVDRLAKTDRLVVTEERTVIHLWSASPSLRLMSIGAIASLARFVFAARLGADSRQLFTWLAFGAAFLLGLSEIRWVRVVSPLEMVALAVLIFDGIEALKNVPALSQRPKRIALGTLALGTMLWIVVWPNLGDRASAHGDFCGQQPVIEEASAWFAQKVPVVEGVPAWGVVGPWDWGHHLHVLGRVPVVFDPMNLRYDDRRYMIEVLRDVWWSHTGKELQDALARYRARYLVLFDPFRDIIGILGADSSRRDDFVRIAPDGGVVFGAALNQFAAFRLFAARGLATETGELQLQFASLPMQLNCLSCRSGGSGRVRAPRVQIYEVKPGATIEGSAPSATTRACKIEFDVVWGETDPERVILNIPLQAHQRFRFKTALPAPFQGHGFAIPEPYRVTCGSWSRRVQVSPAAVDHGTLVPVS